MTSEDEKYFIIEITPKAYEIVKNMMIDIANPVHEYHDVFEYFSGTLKIVDREKRRVYFVYTTSEDEVDYTGNGIEVYISNKIPDGEKHGSPKLISRRSINRIIEMMNEYGADLRPKPPDIPLEIISIQHPVIENKNAITEIMLPSSDIAGIVKKGKRKIPQIARILVNDFSSLYYVKNLVYGRYSIGLYCWDGKRYVECEKFMEMWLKNIYDHFDMDKKEIRFTTLKKEFTAQLTAMTQEPVDYEYLYISFKNKVLDWRALLNEKTDNAFRDHSPELFVKHYIPWSIDDELVKKHVNDEYTVEKFEKLAFDHTPFFIKLFKSWVNEHWINLYEIIGYTMYPRYDLHKSIMLLGSGRNGKSTFLGLLKRILGSDNVVSISLQKLSSEKDRFSMSMLRGKLANIYPDLPAAPLKNTGKFKILTGEDYVCADRKFKDPVCFTNYAKLIFSANELPKVDDTSIAFWRRWIVIEFPNQFKRKPRFLDSIIATGKEEIPRLIALSVIAITNVLKRGYFTHEQSELDYKEKWMYETDPVYAFLKDMEKNKIYEIDGKGYVEAGVLYADYVNWSRENDREVLAKREFTIELEKHGIKKVVIHGKHYYKGITKLTDTAYLGE